MPAETPSDALIGRVLDGRYRIESQLGEGGLGVVYRAKHVRLGRGFAIKVLQPAYAQNDSLRARFEREAKALGVLNHPSIVGVTDFGIDAEVPFLVMELLEGATLEAHLPMEAERALGVLRDVLGAVAYAHGLGLVHRDLKPANVFLEALPEGQERVRVLDFGLAKFLDGSDGSALTRPGATLGTPAYMSPEQALGGAASPRNDVYALGILLYELLAHERPFRGEGGEMMRQHLLVPVPSIVGRRADLQNAALLDEVIQRSTAKAPGDRYADATEMRSALDRALGRQSGAFAASRAPTPIRPQPMPESPKERSAADATVSQKRSGPRAVDGAAQTVLATTPSVPSGAQAVGSVIAPHATVEDAATVSDAGVPLPRMPASRPPPSMHTDGARRDAPRSNAGLGVVLGLSLLMALGAFAFFVPSLLGIPLDPAAWTRVDPPPGVSTVAAVSAADSTGAGSTGSTGAGSTGAGSTSIAAPPDAGRADAGRADPFGGRDPWLAPMSPELSRFRARVDRGEPIGDGARASLRLILRDAPGDPRPLLLMAHANFAAGARTDAIGRYGRAMEVSPSARHDPQMLHNLVVMSAHRTVGASAAAMVREVYGASALTELRAVRAALEDTDEIERLDALEIELLALPPRP